MPKIELVPLDGHSSFLHGHPGLDAVHIRGLVRLSHKNLTQVKRIPHITVRLCGVILTKVRPPSDKGIRGQKFKGRWNLHAAVPPLVLYGGGSKNAEELLLHPGEIKEIPFEFRFGRHEALADFPASLILPSVNDLRSRGETRHWIECTMNWYRKGGIILSERRVAIEVWVNPSTPKILAGMLVARPATESRAGSICSSVSSVYNEQQEQTQQEPIKRSHSSKALEAMIGRSNVGQTPESNPLTSHMDGISSKLSITSLSGQERRLSVASANEPSANVPGGVQWHGNGYTLKLNRHVCTGGEKLDLFIQVNSSQMDHFASTNVVEPVLPENTSNSSTPKKSSSVFPGFSKMVSKLKKKPGHDTPIVQPIKPSNLCTLKVYIEETQTVRAPLDSGDVSVVNEAHRTYLDNFVGKNVSPLTSSNSINATSSGSLGASGSTRSSQQLSPNSPSKPPESPEYLVRTVSGIKQLHCITITEEFEGEFTNFSTIIPVPPLFGVEDVEALVEAAKAPGPEFETPVVTNHDDIPRDSNDYRPFDSRAPSANSSVSEFSLRMPSPAPSSILSSIGDDSVTSRRPSIVAATKVEQTELGARVAASSRLSQRPSRTLISSSTADLGRLRSVSRGRGRGRKKDVEVLFGVHPTCEHPAVSVSHEIVVVLEVPNAGALEKDSFPGLHHESLTVPEDLHATHVPHHSHHHHQEESEPRVTTEFPAYQPPILNPRLKLMADILRGEGDKSKRKIQSQSAPDLRHVAAAAKSKFSSEPTLEEPGTPEFVLAPMTPTISISAVDDFALEPPHEFHEVDKSSSEPVDTNDEFREPPPSSAPDVVPPLEPPRKLANSIQSSPAKSNRIELRHPIIISSLSVMECREIVATQPSLAGDGLFGVPLGFVEDDEWDVYRKGSQNLRSTSPAGLSMASVESRVSWRNL